MRASKNEKQGIYTLEEAIDQLKHGSKFGDVYPSLANVHNDGETLKEFFVKVLGDEDVHHKTPDTSIVDTPHDLVYDTSTTKQQGYTGDICDKCYSNHMVRTGVCLTCLDCGSTGSCG